MGSCFSLNYACLYLVLWEEMHVLNPNNTWHEYITWYGRYIDDLLIIFSGNETALLAFHEYLNSLNPNIRLSIEYSQTSIDFLDVTISKDVDGDLHTTIFRKKTSRNTLLRADSFHPRYLVNNIPFGQFQRLRRICDTDRVFNQQANDMSVHFHDRAYKPGLVSRARDRAGALDPTDLLSKNGHKRRTTSQSLPFFVTQYSTAARHIERIIKANWTIIESDPSLK